MEFHEELNELVKKHDYKLIKIISVERRGYHGQLLGTDITIELESKNRTKPNLKPTCKSY